jgi:hypothetical protein
MNSWPMNSCNPALWCGWFMDDDTSGILAVVHQLHHGVNVAEAIKVGAVWHRVTGAQADLANTAVALDRLTRIAGSPSGAFIADEAPPTSPCDK